MLEALETLLSDRELWLKVVYFAGMWLEVSNTAGLDPSE
jgi:hypothetical protein